MSNNSWNDSLDEMLEKLNRGDFIDQSVNEFEKTVDDTVLGSSRKTNYRTSTNYSTTNYRTVVPHIDRAVENATYNSRIDQIVNCLSNISYSNYQDSKVDGYSTAISHYLDEVKAHQDNLKEFENQVANDLATYKQKVRSTNEDDYLLGYYDAILMVKKVLNNSRLARLAELAKKVGR